MTIQIKGITAAAMYFALGLLSYMMIGDFAVFAWTDPWLYVYMAFWPFIWGWYFFLWVAAIIIIVLIGIVVLDWCDKWS